jgi:hypothetical protein
MFSTRRDLRQSGVWYDEIKRRANRRHDDGRRYAMNAELKWAFQMLIAVGMVVSLAQHGHKRGWL